MSNFKFSDNDLNEIFYSGNNNTSITGFPQLNYQSIESDSQNIMNLESNVNYSENNNDFINLLSPKFYDYQSDSVISVPSWCNKIGFILQAKGGSGGKQFTNYWRKINIIAYTTGYQTEFYNTYSQGTNQWNYYHYRRKGKCWYSAYSYYHITHNHSRTTYFVDDYYYRNSYSNRSYTGSGGGGGGCVAGIYTIDNNNRINNITYQGNYNDSYSQIYFDSNNYVNSLNGGDASILGDSYVDYTNNSTNTRVDTPGSGGTTLIVSNNNKITTYYSSNGSTGDLTGINDNSNIGGAPGYVNSSDILNRFLPQISSSYGKGGNGTNTTSTNDGNSNYFRVWFLM